MIYRNSHTAPGYGNSYHAAFLRNSVRRLYWELERDFLGQVIFDLVSQFAKGRVPIALDFACGTGRVARFLHESGLNVIGVDVSDAMLTAGKIS